MPQRWEPLMSSQASLCCDECGFQDDWVAPAIITSANGHREFLDLCEFCADELEGAVFLDDEDADFSIPTTADERFQAEYGEDDRRFMRSLMAEGKTIGEVASLYAVDIDVVREQVNMLWDTGALLPKDHPFAA